MGNWLIHHELERQARWRSDQTAIRFEGTTYTFAEFDRRVNCISRTLRDAGVTSGDCLIVHGHNHADLYALFFACSKLGAVYSPISTFQSEQNIQYIIDRLDPSYVFYTADEGICEETLPPIKAAAIDAEFVSLDRRSVDDDLLLEDLITDMDDTKPPWSDNHDAADTHNIFWTSGTTGRPKGVIRDHKATLHFDDVLLGEFPFGPENIRITTNDMMFAAPYLQYGLPTVMSGTENIVLRTFTPETVYEHCQEYGVSVMMLAFTQGTVLLDYLNDNGLDLSVKALHAVTPSAEHARRLSTLTDELYHIFATTETGVVATKRLREPFADPPALGTPGRSVDVKIVPPGQTNIGTAPVRPGDTGELLVRGDTTMTRYLEAEHQEELVRDGWIHTGDSVEVTDNYELAFLGRIDDRIRSGGVNIYPSEIESILLEHPDVEEAIVVGVEDKKWGQRVCALILTDVSDVDVLETELGRHCKESTKLTSEMRPKMYAFVESQGSIPTGAVNKVDRGEIVERFFAA